MSEFDDLMSAGFSEAITQCGQTLTLGSYTASVITLPMIEVRMLRDSGLYPSISTSIEILRSEAERIGLVDRSTVEIDGESLRVLGIDDDPGDPCLRVHLRRKESTP